MRHPLWDVVSERGIVIVVVTKHRRFHRTTRNFVAWAFDGKRRTEIANHVDDLLLDRCIGEAFLAETDGSAISDAEEGGYYRFEQAREVVDG